MCRKLKDGEDGARRFRRCFCWTTGYLQSLVDAKKRVAA
jgi:hypothetical protein